MKTDLEKKAEELIDSFNKLDVYKLFIAAKKAIAEDEELNLLKKEIDINKKQIKDFKNNQEKLKEHLKKTKDLENRYESNPLIINYNLYKSELQELVKPLVFMFED